jgi:hypothetical protein
MFASGFALSNCGEQRNHPRNACRSAALKGVGKSSEFEDAHLTPKKRAAD